ncbi:MAG TPA: ATP-binding protein [Bryobacteraceae bacterium]|nr:ATP-binding protein [Bryobacteraceae bacterium]
MSHVAEVAVTDLRRVCDPVALGFETTEDLPVLSEVLGQPRAVAALELGASFASQGFNLFALGQPGSGKTTLIRDYLRHRAQSEPPPPDLCYVYNFANARCPLPLLLPAGRGPRLKQDVDAFVDELKTEIPKAFETEEYTNHRNTVIQTAESGRRQIAVQIEHRAAQAGFQILKGPGSLLLVPVVDGKPLNDEDLAKLDPAKQARIAEAHDRVQHEIEDRLVAIRELEKGARDALRSLDSQTTAYVTSRLLDDLRTRYRDQPVILAYLDAMQVDITANVDDFRKGREAEPVPQPLAALMPPNDKPLARYQVNVMVTNDENKGAPVIVETNPTYHNLTGRIEHQATWTGVITDHTMIKAGALHRAHGGYLIIPARECLLNPFAWEGLKRALKDGVAKIEELGAQLSLMSTVTLDPEPVPLSVKVVLIGSPMLYYLLFAYDEDFQKLFKIKAEFTTRMPRDAESERAYARFVNTIARLENAGSFNAGAVARVIEFGSRSLEEQDQLSTRFGEIADLVREAAHRARQAAHPIVTAADVRAAEEARRYRNNLLEERLQESLVKGTVLVDTAGSAVGRINGLSVLGIGDYAFGHPVRLTAAVAPGRKGIISIDREVELSGPIHGKGVLILSGYLLQKYGHAGPLSLSASLVFEQSYGMVDGDSATVAELCVLLSAVSGAPLRQDIAVTGSANQHGQVQAVGGVNQKIEGFFDLCRARGLTGTQGVILPAANRRNLMLRDDVVGAVAEGKFHIWTAELVDDALELLTGVPAGEPDASGVYPVGTLHRLVADRLAHYAEELRAVQATPAAMPPVCSS